MDNNACMITFIILHRIHEFGGGIEGIKERGRECLVNPNLNYHASSLLTFILNIQRLRG